MNVLENGDKSTSARRKAAGKRFNNKTDEEILSSHSLSFAIV